MIGIEAHTEYEVAELICLSCLNRWIGVYPSEKSLKDIICSKCDKVGCVIKTGQTLPRHYLRIESEDKIWHK
jgi:Zn finger protein HypA/HybF involved in hydrogenase expression